MFQLESLGKAEAFRDMNEVVAPEALRKASKL